MDERKISVIEYFVRFFFPPRCVCCDALLPLNAAKELCKDCNDELPILQKREYLNPSGSGRVYCAFDYEKGIRKAIHNLKFNDRPQNASILIDLAYSYLDSLLSGIGSMSMDMRTSDDRAKFLVSSPVYDIITYVPMHPGRKRKRGYNQSELLAARLAIHMNIPVIKNVIFKVTNTPAQSALGKAGRFRNLIGAFKIKNSAFVAGKRVLLVDDVMTTGSTLEQCRKALKDAGAIQVDAFVVAIRRKLI